MGKMISVTEVTKTKTRIKNNRKNGKRYEGELVKILRESGYGARLGRSNEEGDIVISELNMVIEVKSTNLKDRYPISKSPDQFHRLTQLPQNVWYAIRFKGDGVSGWRFYPIPDRIRILFRSEGYSLDEFVLMQQPKEVSNAIQ